jgi:heme-degrading monooxygenase HmoA
MSQEILSVAIYEALPGQEEASLETIQDLFAALNAAGYSRDRLYRDGKSHYIVVRYWKSEESRRAALEDAAVQRCWAKLAHQIEIVKIYERLDEVALPPL